MQINLKTSLILSIVFVVTACSHQPSKPVLYCPSLITYSEDFNTELINELERVESPRVIQTISDYYALRRTIKECNE